MHPASAFGETIRMTTLHRCRAIVAFALALVPAAAIAARDDAASPTAAEATEVLREGKYVLSYFGATFAEETFRIERTASGYRITATYEPERGDQIASRSTYVLDERRRLVSATFEPTGGGISATYRIEDGELIATPSEGAEQRFPLEDGDLIAGPHFVTDFYILHPLEYDVDERGEHVCYTFGFQDWRVHRNSFAAERLRDRRIEHPDGERRSAVVYRCRIETSQKTYKTRSYLGDDGAVIKMKIGAPIGEATIELKPAD